MSEISNNKVNRVGVKRSAITFHRRSKGLEGLNFRGCIYILYQLLLSFLPRKKVSRPLFLIPLVFHSVFHTILSFAQKDKSSLIAFDAKFKLIQRVFLFYSPLVIFFIGFLSIL